MPSAPYLSSSTCLRDVRIKTRFCHCLHSISCKIRVVPCSVPVWPCSIYRSLASKFFRHIYQRSLRMTWFWIVLCFAADTWIHLRWWLCSGGRTYQVFYFYSFYTLRYAVVGNFLSAGAVAHDYIRNTIACEYWSTISVLLVCVKADGSFRLKQIISFYHWIIVLFPLRCTVEGKLFNFNLLYLLFARAKQATYLYLNYTVHV
jgi:hypothetical protein